MAVWHRVLLGLAFNLFLHCIQKIWIKQWRYVMMQNRSDFCFEYNHPKTFTICSGFLAGLYFLQRLYNGAFFINEVG